MGKKVLQRGSLNALRLRSKRRTGGYAETMQVLGEVSAAIRCEERWDKRSRCVF